MNRPRGCARLGVLLALTVGLLGAAPPLRSSTPGNLGLPDQLTDSEFWQMITEFSEPDGAYPFENFVSNEASIQTVIPALKQLVPPGGVYLGVGPEQNFTYISALQSKMAFVVDIRRQNMLELLLYKAIFELSPTRADFVGRLFSRKRPEGLNEQTSVSDLFAAYQQAPTDDVTFNSQAVRHALIAHNFPLSSQDFAKVDHVYQVFARGGPSITYDFESPGQSGIKPLTYAQMMAASDADGKQWSYLATEAAYQHVREMQRRNLIIPIVGDFAGPTALRSVGLYLRERKAAVSTFYVSNVEMELDGPPFKDFQANVVTLPVNASSMFIRWAPPSSTEHLSFYRSSMGQAVTTIASMRSLVDLFMANKAPSSWAETLQGTKDPAVLLRPSPDPTLRKVVGRVLGGGQLEPNESLRVELVESPRGSGLIFQADVGSDGSFEFTEVQPRVYDAIVLKTCKDCGFSTGLGATVRVVIAKKDISGLKLVVPSR